MKFSVVGLPHYTIWHLYEPSVDDIKHMEVCELFFCQNIETRVMATNTLLGNGGREKT